jgi:hypothetical protein
MTNKEAKILMKKHGHKFWFCKTCKRPTIICGYCGNNCCNGGCGGYKLVEKSIKYIPCIDNCKEAYEISEVIKYPLFYRIKALFYKIKEFFYIKAKKFKNN